MGTTPDALPLGRSAEAVLATATIGTGVVLAAYCLDAPLHVNESKNILFYATQPLAAIASTYDDTNNHILHTLLVGLVHRVGGGWSRVALRIPAFLSFCLLLPALWWFVRREYGAKAAVFATALVGSSPFFVSYAANARGYTLMLLLFVVALLCCQALLRTPDRKALWAVWAAAIALGFYTMPLMVFPMATTIAWAWLAMRKCGGTAVGRFAARTVAWAGVALAAAIGLYLPVLSAGGLGPARTLATISRRFDGQLPDLVLHPATLWSQWHWATPIWASGLLLAFVVAGFTAHGRSCGRRGTLLLATCLALGLLLARPLLLEARMAIWVLLPLMVAAGVGIAAVMEGACLRVRTRWPAVLTGRRQRALECVALALVLALSSWWSTRTDVYTSPEGPGAWASPALAAMALSVTDQMQPDDYFASCNLWDRSGLFLYVKEAHASPRDVESFGNHRLGRVAKPPPPFSTPHRAAGPPGPHAGTLIQPWRESLAPGRLLLFDTASGPCDNPLFSTALPDLLTAQWPNYELVAAFQKSTGGVAQAYALNDWTPKS